ncbi:Nn.00g090780.m01.CDS01 [Neocucurbitaria sp. VM-36]
MNRFKLSENSATGVSFYREECTEKNWLSGKCLSLCTDNINAGDVMMTPCDGTPTSENWCCGNSTDCCTSNFIVVAKSFGTNGNETSSITSLTVSSSTMPPTLPSSNVSTSNNGQSRLDGGAIAGTVIGIVASLVLVFVAGFACAKKRQATRNVVPEIVDETKDTNTYNASHAVADPSDQYRNRAHEAGDLDSHVIELPEATMSELDEQMRPREVA